MGAWGSGIYENDDAADWTAEFADLGLEAVEAALDVALGTDYLESPEGACALAAADVVARLVSGRGEDSPYCEDVVAWVQANRITPSAALVEKARAAVSRVRGADSELAELWSEDPASSGEWSATIADVEERLSA
jgi:hypothetical protein